MNNIFILIGPTASGKSNLAMKLMSKFPFEIINADLYSTYKGLNIGTAKPLKEELNKYKHHLINILEPTMDYNVSQYCKDANKCINEILSSNKIPLITGGSMMYVYQLLNGLSHEYNVSDTDLKLIKFIQNQYTNEQIVKAISGFNPALINKININDSYRIEKLLERLISNKNNKHNFKGLYKEKNLKIHIIFITIDDREFLRESIKKRTSGMLNDGLIEEVKNLLSKFNLNNKTQCMKAIGYKETLQFLNKDISLDDAKFVNNSSNSAAR
ncbi:MAG: tRNA (adenosine(37)-N6)-dimethylallyltransferase MiaA [Gammaproteobacteria bacterium]